MVRQFDLLLQSSLSVLLPTFLFSMKKDYTTHVSQWNKNEGHHSHEARLWWGILHLQP